MFGMATIETQKLRSVGLADCVKALDCHGNALV